MSAMTGLSRVPNPPNVTEKPSAAWNMTTATNMRLERGRNDRGLVMLKSAGVPAACKRSNETRANGQSMTRPTGKHSMKAAIFTSSGVAVSAKPNT